MVKRNHQIFIKDVLDCILKIEHFAAGMSFDEFVADDKTMSAVIRKLEIIGEAVKNVPLAIRRKHSKIDWKEIAGMRDKLIHDYFGVDAEILWEVIKEDIPTLKPLIEQVFREVEK